MKNLVLCFFAFLSLSAKADYEIENGSILYTAVTSVEYFFVLGSEQGNTLENGASIQFDFGQRAIFRGDNFKEAFVPLAEIQNIKSIVDIELPKAFLGSATLYQFNSENMSSCRILLQISENNPELKRFLLKAKDMRLDIHKRKNHFSIGC